MLKLAFCSANGTELAILSKAVKKISDQYELAVLARENKNFREPEALKQFIDFAVAADYLIISLHGGKDKSIGFEEIIAAMPEAVKIYIHFTSPPDAIDSMAYSSIEKEDYLLLSQYLTYSGWENYANCLLYLLGRSGQATALYNPPEPLPWEGIYHPDFAEIPDPDRYFREKVMPQRLTVGLWFHREHWSNGDTGYVDAFIREFESRNINVIPVFRKSRKEADLGNMGLKEVLDHFFKQDGQPVVDVLVNLMSFSASMMTGKSELSDQAIDEVLADFGVPILKGMIAFANQEDWQNATQGLSPVDVIANAALPEMDGNIITLAGAFTDSTARDPITGAQMVIHKPDAKGISGIVDLAENWGKLKHIANSDKRVAILFHNYPPRNDTIGSAFGLDSKESVYNLLKKLQESGYTLDHLPENGRQIITELLTKTTNDLRWLSSAEIHHRAVDTIPKLTYEDWFKNLPQVVQDQMSKAWDQPPGEFFSHQGQLAVPGVINGNIFLGIQPPRGNTLNPESVYHSPDLPMPHCYYAYYEWIRHTFKADAIIHVGMHGTLEWLPGKALGLSDGCYPRIAISDLPHLYVYIINNPGEGTQAKRRSNCCIIDHLIPVMTRAELYEDTAELETQLQDYYQCQAMNPEKLGYLQKIIWEKVVAINLHKDLNLGEVQPDNFEAMLEQLHDYLGELKETQIKTGLHTLGEAPQGDKLIELLLAMTLLPNGETPSLRQTVATLMGHDLDELLDNRGKKNTDGKRNGDILEEIYQKSVQFLKRLAEDDFDEAQSIKMMMETFGVVNADLVEVTTYLCSSLVPRLKDCRDELTAVKNGLAGKFIKPGPTGSPTRGMAHILPTGRNFYSIDPQTVPSPTAWEAGKRLAENMLDKYKKEKGTYPENVGMVVFGTSTMRTNGEDEAEILYLLGVKPVWQKQNAYVKDLEVIPLHELGRSRIDVTTRISGLFRDTFPNLVDLIDRAVLAVIDLDEPDEMNYVAKHVKAEMAELLKNGIDFDQAREESRYRIFGCKPGAYGAGVCNIVDTKAWQSDADLADIYLTWGGYAYSQQSYGKKAPELFKKRLSVMDAAVMNLDSREFEMIDSDDFYSFHGGMIASVRTFKGSDPMGLIGDSTNPQRIKTRTVSEETRFELRSRVFNPKWIDSMKEHGYKGAGDISQIVDHLFGWDVTARVMDDKLYEELAEKFVLDKEFSDWLREVNPWALQNISERLLEAIQRERWQPDHDMVAKLQNIYLEMEGAAEEC